MAVCNFGSLTRDALPDQGPLAYAAWLWKQLRRQVDGRMGRESLLKTGSDRPKSEISVIPEILSEFKLV
jgi:hypothetical protein